MFRSTGPRIAMLIALGFAASCGAGDEVEAPAIVAPLSCTLAFRVDVRSGPDAGLSRQGNLSFVMGDAGNFSAGAFELNDGTVLPATGSLGDGGLALSITFPDGRKAGGQGSAPLGNHTCPFQVSGSISGPDPADVGDWSGTVSGGSATDPATGNLYLSMPGEHDVYKKSTIFAAGVLVAGGKNVPGYVDAVALAARFNGPNQIAVDSGLNTLFVCDVANQRVRGIKLDSSRVTTTLGLVDAQAALKAAGFSSPSSFSPSGVTVDPSGIVYIADVANSVLYRYAPSTGKLKLLAGTPGSTKQADGTGTAARFIHIGELSMSPDGLIINLVDGCVVRQCNLAGSVVTQGTASINACPPYPN